MVEFLASRNDTPLFALASHTKKRPHSLILGRLYDGQILDMIEVYVKFDTFKSISTWTTERNANVKAGAIPSIMFNGDDFENDTKPDFILLKSILLDMFHGTSTSGQGDKINLASLDRVIVCTAHNDTVYFRQYAILMKKSGTKFPRVELEEIGPTMDLQIGRSKSASLELKAHSLRTEKRIQKKGHVLKKNIETDSMGHKTGRLHIPQQELNTMALKKMKGLKKKRKREDNEEDQPSATTTTTTTTTTTQGDTPVPIVK